MAKTQNNELVDMLKIEKELLEQGYQNICGIDEAGRGPLAGNVVAAAVILPDGMEIDGVNDSKKLSEKKREALFDVIMQKALAVGIGQCDSNEIDEHNILNATFIAMRRAVENLSIKPDFLIIDGNLSRKLEDYQNKPIIGGDAKSMSIAAASIIAKVTRDRQMVKSAELYPKYGFEKHKGYGTKVHNEAILQHGPCEIHRKTFLTKILGKK